MRKRAKKTKTKPPRHPAPKKPRLTVGLVKGKRRLFAMPQPHPDDSMDTPENGE